MSNETMKDGERAAFVAERDAAIMSTHRQALCIQQCAAHIGPDTSATIDGLPLAVKRVVQERNAARTAAPQAALTDEQIFDLSEKYFPQDAFRMQIAIRNFARALLTQAPTERMSDSARDAEDAARYRWLKEHDFWLPTGAPYEEGIDAARKAEIERGEPE